MADSQVKGVSLPSKTWRSLDQLAKREGESRSGMVGRLVERASSLSSEVPDVRVDGVRFVPVRRS